MKKRTNILLVSMVLLMAGQACAMEHQSSSSLSEETSARSAVEQVIDHIISKDNMVCNDHAVTCLVSCEGYNNRQQLHFFNSSGKLVGAYDLCVDGSLNKEDPKSIIPLDSKDSWVDKYTYSDAEGIFERACLFNNNEFDFSDIQGMDLSSEEIFVEMPSAVESFFIGLKKVKQALNRPGKHIGRYCSIENKRARYGISAALYSVVLCGAVNLYNSFQDDEDDDIDGDIDEDSAVKIAPAEHDEIVDQKMV